jgi:tetrapyrrole methylase family protein/MazG family protein
MSNQTGQRFERLVEVVTQLRRKCPWDKKQTLESLKPYLVEEVYEAMQAIDEKDYSKLTEELGDMLLHVVMLSVFAAQAKKFSINEVIEVITAKMIRRHPHVFAGAKAKDQAEIWRRWELIKQKEKKGKAEKKGMLESVPHSLPALYRADKLQRRAARVGFDWDKVAGAWAKVHEELDEVHELIKVKIKNKKFPPKADAPMAQKSRIKEEIGDLLFAVTNVARKLNIDAEEALQQANNKFIRRFSYIDKKLQRNKKMTVEQMDVIWNRVKASEK